MTAAVTRPQSIGELLDRSIRTYVRVFGSLYAALAVIAIPLLVFQLVTDPSPHASFIASLARGLPGFAPASGTSTVPAFRPTPGAVAFALLTIAIYGLANAMQVAVGVAVSVEAIAGRRVSIASAYRATFNRLGRILGMLPLFTGAGVVVMLFAVLVIGLPVALLIVVVPIARRVIIPLIALVGAALGLALFGIVQLAWSQSVIAAMGEPVGSWRAFRAGWERTFTGPFFGHALLAVLTLFVIQFGVYLLGDGLAELVGAIPHLEVLGNVPPVLVGIAADGLQIVFVVWYAIDLRHRSQLYASSAG